MPLPSADMLPARTSTQRTFVAFLLDALIVVFSLLALSLLGGVVWALSRLITLDLTQTALQDPAAVVQSIGQPGAIASVWMALFSTGGAALLVYFWRRRASVEERRDSRHAALRLNTWGWACAAGAATFLSSALLGWMGQQVGIQPQPSNLALIEAATAANPVFMMLFGVVIAPAYEELLFRRVLFGRWWAAGKPWLGLLLSSAAFALMHEIPGVGGNTWQATALLWVIYGFMGAAFAWVYWRTRTLWAAIGAHALNNVIALTLLSLPAGN